MTVLSILPILPGLGGAFWGLTLLAGMALSLLHPRGWRLWLSFARSQWRGLAVLAAVAASACAAWALWPARREAPPAPPVELTFDHWPMFQGSLQRQGGDGGTGPSAGGVLWTARSEYEFLGAPAVSGNVVAAVGSARGTARCFCWDAETGRELWSGGPNGYRTTLSSPVLSGNRIYCGEGVHHTADARIHCLDPARGPQALVWEHATAGHVECSPVVQGGRVYIAAGNDGVYCLSAADHGAVIWHVSGSVLPDVETALAVHGGRVYVGLGFETPGLVALDAATGAELVRVPLPLPMFAPPALFADGLLCGLGPGTLRDAATAGPGEARLVDRETLETRWTLPLPASMIQSAAVVGDAAYLVSADGVVQRVDRLGRLTASWRSPAPIAAAPAVAGDLVYVVSQEGELTGLTQSTLSPRWSVRLGTSGQCLGSPVVCRGRVYVGTPAGLMCVGPHRQP